MNKESKITKVEVIDKKDNVLISMNYNKIEYDKKFDKDYFDLKNIINIGDNNKVTENNNSTTNYNETNKENLNETNNSKPNETNTTNSNSEINTENDSNSKDNDKQTEQTATIEDIIYPMYLPENTYLTSQEKINTNNGERLILTFGGDNAFTLVEETISNNNDNIVIPVNGEFDFLSDVIGIIGTNSVMWQSNGIEYYMTSNTLKTSVLVEIARSISVLPVSK